MERMIVLEEKRNEIALRELTQSLRKAVSKFRYDTHDDRTVEHIKATFRKIAKNMDPLITETINHTGLPDEFVLNYLAVTEGVLISSINVFESVFLRFEEEDGCIRVHMDVTFAEPIEIHKMTVKLDRA